MKQSDIKPGDFVTNETFVREFVTYQGYRAYYYDYSLRDGRPIGHGLCGPDTLAKWAKRKATAEEIERLDRDGARTNIANQQEAQARLYIQAAPTAWLEEELARRAAETERIQREYGLSNEN